MRCYKCGKDLPPDSKFCQFCGEDLSHVRYCPFCGIQLQEGMNFCPRCGKDIRKTTSGQPIESNNVIPTQNEVTIPAWSKTAAIVPGTAPIEDSEKQEEPTTSWEKQHGGPTDARNSILKEKVETSEEPVPESSEGTQAEKEMAEEEPLPTTGEQIKETGGASQKQKKSKWIWVAALCIIVVVVAGVCLWPRNNSESGYPTESKVDISKIADSVLYLEVFDENNDLIGSASGFLVNDQSTLVTNYHVVQDAYHIVAKTADGAQATDVSCILAYDEIADLAVLSCDSKVMAEPLTLGDSETVQQGDAVYAVGYPLGLANTLSDGIVSSRYIDEYDNDTIQVTAAISEGNSGGPLLDENGQVIGVMCAYYVYGQNLNIATASDTLAGLLESEYEKTNLKYWQNRPTMPDAEAEIEEIQGSNSQEVKENPGENTGSESSAKPEKPKVIGDNNNSSQSGEPNKSETGTVQKTEQILQGAWKQKPLDSMPFNKYDYFEFSGNNVYYESYYCSLDAEFIQTYTGTFTIDKNGSLCFHMTHAETYFADGTQEINNTMDAYWAPRPITALSEDSYTTSGVLTYYRTSNRPTKLSEWKTNNQSRNTSAFSFLSEWITNNSNTTMSGDKAYQEILTDEDSRDTYKVIYSAGINQICLMYTIDYYDGHSFSTYLWLKPTGKSFNSTFYQYSAVDSTNTFKGSSVINASSFNENSAYTFDSYEGDSSMLDTSQSLAKYMYLDSLNFLNYIFYTYAVPAGYNYSTSDFGFNI